MSSQFSGVHDHPTVEGHLEEGEESPDGLPHGGARRPAKHIQTQLISFVFRTAKLISP